MMGRLVIAGAGALAGLFALALLILPAVRVAQGRLPLGHALGLWIAGVGFALLAAAALLIDPGRAAPAALAGVVLTVLGNVAQRKLGPDSSETR